MQDPEHQKAKCAKCKAPKGEPCVDRYGNIADKVHYGRPYWSAMADRKPFKMRGGSLEIEFDHLEEFKVVLDLNNRSAVAAVERQTNSKPRVHGWGACDGCRSWMLREPGLPATCVVCRAAS